MMPAISQPRLVLKNPEQGHNFSMSRMQAPPNPRVPEDQARYMYAKYLMKFISM
jgi:hypothetical protein